MSQISGVLSALFDAIVDNAGDEGDLENHGYWRVHTWLESLQIPEETTDVFDESANEAIDAPNQAAWWVITDPLEPAHDAPTDVLVDLSPLVAVYEEAVRVYSRIGELKALSKIRDLVNSHQEAYDEERQTWDGEMVDYLSDLAIWQQSMTDWEREHAEWLADEERDDDDEPESPEDDKPDQPEEPDVDYINGSRWVYEQALAHFGATEEDLEDY